MCGGSRNLGIFKDSPFYDKKPVISSGFTSLLVVIVDGYHCIVSEDSSLYKFGTVYI